MIRKNILKAVCILLLATSIVISSTAAMVNISDVQSPMKAVWLSTGYTSVQPQPADTLSEIWIHFDDGINNDGIGMGGGGTWEGAIRMTPGELRYYENWKLVVVKWYHYVVPGTSKIHSGNIKIYSQGEPNLPGSLLTSEPYTVTSGGWCEIPLSNPVTISADEDIWVSIEITHGGGEYPLGVDAGPAIITKGDWIYGAGTGWKEMRIMGMNYNWNIHALLVGGEDHESPITTCNITGEQEDDIYVSDVSISFKAIDYLSGINRTMYKIDDNEWQTYVDPVIVAEDGDHILYYYSVDNAGNIESTKNQSFTIRHPMNIEINITGGFGIITTFKNIGENNVTNLSWNLTLEGGFIIIPRDKNINGTMNIPANSTIVIRSFVFGFGKTRITVLAETADSSDVAERDASVFLFFIKIIDG